MSVCSLCPFHVFPATLNSSDYIVQAVISVSDLEHLRTVLSTLSVPVQINSTVEITSINTTTGITTSFHCVVYCSTLAVNMWLNLDFRVLLFLPVVCSSNATILECRCEQSFAWSYNSCISHGACDDIIGDTCGCITALPLDGQYCQLNTSQPGRPGTTTKHDCWLSIVLSNLNHPTV